MSPSAVSWRRTATVVLAAVLAIAAVTVVVRSDGLPAVDATTSRATRWFVHQATGRVVLADGYAGRALARLDGVADGAPVEVAEGATGAYVLDGSRAEARPIDTAALRIGPGIAVAPLATPSGYAAGVGPNGLVVAGDAEAALVSRSGETIPFELAEGTQTHVATDGAVWIVVDDTLVRTTSTASTSTDVGTDAVELTTVGPDAFVLDSDGARARFHDGRWVRLPDGVASAELVVQEPGPAADCAWVGADDDLWCIGHRGIDESVSVGGLDLDGADRLAIAGDAAAVVRSAPAAIERLDLDDGRLIDDDVADVPDGASLEISATTDVIWIDDTGGDLVWAVNPWNLEAIGKNDAATPLVDDAGEVVEAGASSDDGSPGSVVSAGPAVAERRPDGNGIDDPPVAVDDPVRVRVAASIPIVVTANDFDPDGEGIAVVRVGQPTRGSAEVASASTVVYRPAAGTTGIDRFEYTIADGSGTEASAVVTVELVPVDATNTAPVGRDDIAETATDTAVVVDVLLNDIDPERDPIRLGSFRPADVGGNVTETLGASGLQALRYEPPAGASGTATFTYRPIDALGALGDETTVTVEIAEPGDDNREPVVQPDAVRLRRNVPTPLAVLTNDRDPDGDDLFVEVVRPLRAGIEVAVTGNSLMVTARAGSADLVPFEYTVDDGFGHVVTGSVLVVVVADIEPNRPPLVNADIATAVVGLSTRIDVLANDSDPDGDPLILVSVEQPIEGGGRVVVDGSAVRFVPSAVVGDDSVTVRFRYAVSDGNGHEVSGEVSVTVLPEAVAAPPYARDDAATTERDVPVTIDVLRNDGDPSGGRTTIVGTPGCASGGRATVGADERVTFTPPRGAVGTYRCTYEVTNQRGLRASASIIVSVREPAVTNVAPIVTGEQRTVEVGDVLVVDVLANDVDPDGPSSALTVLSWTMPTLGDAQREGGVITFTAGDVLGPTVISYQVGDAEGGVSLGRLVILVTERIPIAPLANPDGRSIVGPGVPTSFAVLSNDSDPDGEVDALVVGPVAVTSGSGTASVTGSTVTLSPDPAFVGDLIATYAIVDPDGLTASSTVTLTISEPLNRPPVAVDDAADVLFEGAVAVDVLFNDSDPDGDLLALSIGAEPPAAIGSARVIDNAIVFTAAAGASGTASIVYEVFDGEATAQATLTVRVLACAAATPAAPDVSLATGYQQPIAVNLADYARNGTVVDVSPPLSAVSGVVTPPPGENGNIVITYAVVNGCDVRATGTVTIDVNQDPVARPLEVQIGQFEQRSIPVSDLASDGEPLQIESLSGAPAWVRLIGGTSLDLDPAGVPAGTSVFDVVVEDPGGLRATVPLTVTVIDRPPVAAPDLVDASDGPITFSPLDNDIDPDGGAIHIQAIPTSAVFDGGGTASITVLGGDRVRVDPAGGVGIATFSYTIVDQGGQVSAPATVTVRVNRPPVVAPIDVSIPSSGTTGVPVVASDPDGDPLVVTVPDAPSGLGVIVDGSVLHLTAPDVGTDTVFTFTVVVSDPRGASASAPVRVSVAPPPTTTTTTTTTTTPPPPSTTAPP